MPGSTPGDQVPSELEVERAASAHWRRLAQQRSVELTRLSRRRGVRLAMGLERRLTPVTAPARRWAARARAGAEVVALRAGALARRTTPLDLSHAVALLPEPRLDGRRLLVAVVGGRATSPSDAVASVDVVAVPGGAGAATAVRDALRGSTHDLVGLRLDGAEPVGAPAAFWGRLVAAVGGDVVAATALAVHPQRTLAEATAHDGRVRAAGLAVETSADGVPALVGRGAGEPPDPTGPIEAVDAASSACMVVDRAAYEAAGGLPTRSRPRRGRHAARASGSRRGVVRPWSCPQPSWWTIDRSPPAPRCGGRSPATLRPGSTPSTPPGRRCGAWPLRSRRAGSASPSRWRRRRPRWRRAGATGTSVRAWPAACAASATRSVCRRPTTPTGRSGGQVTCTSWFEGCSPCGARRASATCCGSSATPRRWTTPSSSGRPGAGGIAELRRAPPRSHRDPGRGAAPGDRPPPVPAIRVRTHRWPRRRGGQGPRRLPDHGARRRRRRAAPPCARQRLGGPHRPRPGGGHPRAQRGAARRLRVRGGGAQRPLADDADLGLRLQPGVRRARLRRPAHLGPRARDGGAASTGRSWSTRGSTSCGPSWSRCSPIPRRRGPAPSGAARPCCAPTPSTTGPGSSSRSADVPGARGRRGGGA